MENRATKDKIFKKIKKSLNKLQDYLASLSDDDIHFLKDKGGWTIKDHLIHIAVWEDGIDALLQYKSRHERMGLTAEQWQNLNFDEMNSIIHAQHKDKSWAELRQICDETHQRLMKTIDSLSDDELNLPYQHYAPNDKRDEPVWNWIAADTYGHYSEHLTWIRAIVKQTAKAKHNSDGD